MSLDRAKIAIVLAVAAVAALGLSACGRKGALDLPPSDTAPPAAPQASSSSPLGSFMPGANVPPEGSPEAQAAAVKNGFDSHGNPVAAPGEKKDFFLDFLLK